MRDGRGRCACSIKSPTAPCTINFATLRTMRYFPTLKLFRLGASSFLGSGYCARFAKSINSHLLAAGSHVACGLAITRQPAALLPQHSIICSRFSVTYLILQSLCSRNDKYPPASVQSVGSAAASVVEACMLTTKMLSYCTRFPVSPLTSAITRHIPTTHCRALRGLISALSLQRVDIKDKRDLNCTLHSHKLK